MDSLRGMREEGQEKKRNKGGLKDILQGYGLAA